MSRFFNGVADQKIIVTDSAAINSLPDISIAWWAFTVSEGANGINSGRTIDKGLDFLIFEAGIGTSTRFAAERWAGDGQWHWARTLNVWQHHLLTFSYSALANDPVMYNDGVSVTVTETLTPTGAFGASLNQDMVIGNRTAGDRTFDGGLEELAIWNRVLTAVEAKEVYTRGPLAVPTGLVLFMPLDGQSPESNIIIPSQSGVVTGATVGASPSFPSPRGRRPRHVQRLLVR